MIPESRRAAASEIAGALAAARRVTVSSHMNVDGDGAGCEAALLHSLGQRGMRVTLVNPSPFPSSYRFLLPPGAMALGPGREASRALAAADLQIVVDTSEPSRLGDLVSEIDPARCIVIDHHSVGQRDLPARCRLVDPGACASAELVYDVLVVAGFPLGVEAAAGLYVAIVTDTGSFRYSNATPRAHELAARLIALGVRPDEMFRRLYQNLTARHVTALRAALESLRRDPELPVSWIILASDVATRVGELDDWEPILEPARDLEGTEVAVLLRDLGNGTVKVSLRSNGSVDVSAVALGLGGGGHEKASGAVVPAPLEAVATRVREALRRAFGEA